LFLKYRKDFYSQNGEDGILEKLIHILKIKKPYMCEFGAWDGINSSNTFYLLNKYSGKAIYIEGNKKKFEELLNNSKIYKGIYPINSYVDNCQNKLDKILLKTFLKKDFDILSIDIDGDDLNIWKSLRIYKPKIVVIEINSGIKPGIFQINKKCLNKQGNSFTSTLKVGIEKGYTLLCHTGNLIFLKNEYLKKINVPNYLIKNPNRIFYKNFHINRYYYFTKFIKNFVPIYLINKIPTKLKLSLARYLKN